MGIRGAGFDFSDFDFGGFRAGGFDIGGFTYEDLFGDLFGRGRRRGPVRGQDLNYQLKISFDDAFQGVEVPIMFDHVAPCGRCGGSGAEPGTGTVTCPRCHGSGQQRVSQGAFQFAHACSQCGGTGTIISSPCSVCSGQGGSPKTERINVRIPAGVDTGSRVRVAGKGNAGSPGAPPGDLFITVQVSSHGIFRREGADIVFDLPITFAEAARGAKIEIPLPGGGKTLLTVPPGTQGGQKLRLKGKGFPRLKSKTAGDLFAVIKIRVPKAPKGEAADLLERLDRVLDMDPRKGLW
ncbi:MAG: hypothetical protein JSV00_10370 [bacterium]|nr:MAG: hypothetical protein JSV00_10370 [bacterium]